VYSEETEMTMTEVAGGDRVAGAAGLLSRWRTLRAAEPRVRARDAAARLGVSEAELVAARCGDGVRRLRAAWGDLVSRLPEVGEVMVLTRNESAVHEKIGRFAGVSVHGAMGLVLDRDIDLRLFLGRWASGFAVEEAAPDGDVRGSLQFFDAAGTAVHKVYRRAASDRAAWESLAAAFAADDQSPGEAVAPIARAPRRPDDTVDRELLRARWRALRNVHDFHAMLDEVGAARVQAFRLVGGELARRVDSSAFRTVLERAAERALPIMVFVGSPGVVQIHTGPVANLKTVGPWFNVLDPGFDLHLREDRIASAWVVRKPTRDGIVTSLEIFDADDAQIAWLFGERHEGEAEMPAWRLLLDGLPGWCE
jgi:putative hemin transport protein